MIFSFVYLKIGHFFHKPQFWLIMFFWLFSKLNIKMSYTYRNFATKISFKKGFLKSFLIHPLIAFNNGRTVVELCWLKQNLVEQNVRLGWCWVVIWQFTFVQLELSTQHHTTPHSKFLLILYNAMNFTKIQYMSYELLHEKKLIT